jgi:hypothetical protein
MGTRPMTTNDVLSGFLSGFLSGWLSEDAPARERHAVRVFVRMLSGFPPFHARIGEKLSGFLSGCCPDDTAIDHHTRPGQTHRVYDPGLSGSVS